MSRRVLGAGARDLIIGTGGGKDIRRDRILRKKFPGFYAKKAFWASVGGARRYIVARMASRTPSEPRTLAEGAHLRLVVSNGWEFVRRPKISGIVVIVGTTTHGCVVLVTQWREPVGAHVVEWPAGLAGDIPGSETEALEAAARRELFEETGFEAATMEAILTGPPSPGISDEMVTFYRARGMVRKAYGGGRGAERIRTHVVPISWLSEWLETMQAKGFLVDPKVFAGAYWLRQEMDMWMHD